MTKQEILDLWNKTVIEKLNISSRPKFRLGEKVKIVTNEPELHSWTWMDDVRLERKGNVGIIVNMEYIKDHPTFVSGIDYYVRFKDGHNICFVEEHLEKNK